MFFGRFLLASRSNNAIDFVAFGGGVFLIVVVFVLTVGRADVFESTGKELRRVQGVAFFFVYF